MVKNKTGGSRHKKMARKNVNAPVSSKLRLAKEEGEIYAKVTNYLEMEWLRLFVMTK